MLSASYKQVSANRTFNLVWTIGHEGFYSILLQLKTLNFIVNSTQIHRRIAIGNFTSVHYQNGEVHVSMCDYIVMPSHITCNDNSYQNMSQFDGLGPHFDRDMRYVNQPRAVRIRGDPGWWEFSIHKSPAIKAVIAPYSPRLQFHPYFYQLASYVKYNLLKFPLSAKSRYAAIHWRRGDQLTTRCVRDTELVDRSLNCANISSFVAHLQTLQKYYETHNATSVQSRVPIVVLTNEANASVLQLLQKNGIDLLPHNIPQQIVKQLQSLKSTVLMPSSSGSSEVDITIAIEKVKSLPPELVDLVIDSIIMIQATDFYSFGGSFLNDAIEMERMWQGRSFCLQAESHSVGSFCEAWSSTNTSSRQLFRKSLQEFWQHPLSPPTSLLSATAQAKALKHNSHIQNREIKAY